MTRQGGGASSFTHDAVEIAFLDEGGAEIGHGEITDEQDTQIGQVDEHGVVSFTALHGREFDARAADFQLRLAVDCDVGLEAAHIVEIKAFPEKLLAEYARPTEFAGDLFFVVASCIEFQARV